MRTGTMHFMSIEVAAQMFLFCPRLPDQELNFTEMLDEIQQTEGKEATNAMQNRLADVPFSHNHLHDLESLWWVAVWMAFYNHFSNSQQSEEGALSDLPEVERQLHLARILFPSVMKNTDRLLGFQTSFPKVCDDLPSDKSPICKYLNVLRLSLMRHYSAIQSTFPQSIDSNASTDDIYDNFRQAFSLSHKTYSDFALTFIPHVQAQLRGYLKRSRAESTNDPGVVAQRRR